MIMSVERLKEELTDVPMACPTVIDEALPEGDACLLREVGLPVGFAGWFKTVAVVAEAPDVRGASYSVGHRKYHIGRGFVIERTATESLIIDENTGALVCVNEDGQGELLNSSLPQLLLCVAQFEKCTNNEYRDVAARRENCKAIDPAAFSHENSPWSFLFFEAEAGMF